MGIGSEGKKVICEMGFSRPMAGDWEWADEINGSRKDTGERDDEEAMVTIR
jgi:hypothetical protein